MPKNKKGPQKIEVNDKTKKITFKEGGKKGQDICGLRDMGGVSYFHLCLETPAGNLELLKHAMEGMNVVVAPDAEERKGGAGDIAKVLFTCDDDNLYYLMHVPENLEEKMGLQTWFDEINKEVGGECIEKLEEQRMLVGHAKADQTNGKYTLKMRDAAVARGFAVLREKQLVLADEDSDDEMVFGDDDFMM